MRQPTDNIGDIMKNALNSHSGHISFEDVWKQHNETGERSFRAKRPLAAPLIALMTLMILFTVGFTGYSIIRNIDKVDYPFVDDTRVIGKWDSVDFVREAEDFNPEKKSWGEDLFLKSLVFIKEGKMLTAAENDNLAFTSFTWTKDRVLSKQDKTDNRYEIKEINGDTYMFFQWKSGDYVFRNINPHYYVLKKVDNEDYSDFEVKQVKEDNIDYPFIDDIEMKGKWESVDFVKNIEDYKPGLGNWLDDLVLKGLEFREGGNLTISFIKGIRSDSSISWTKGVILDQEYKTASKCEIKEINGQKYMFYEWKSGDYVYRGMKPSYYVLKKVK